MAQHYRFFNSTPDDIREYNASEFAEYFNRFISDGIFSEDGKLGLRVTRGSGMAISVSSGYAFVKGYMYHNDSEISFTIDPSDKTLDRIDVIVLRFDEINRIIELDVKKGSLASSPVAPILENSDTLKELPLAKINVTKGSTKISDVNVIDTRLSDGFGQVSMLIDVPISDMWDIYNDTLSQIEHKWESDINNFNSEWEIIKSTFNDWFHTKRELVGGTIFSSAEEPAEAAAGDYWFKEVD